MHKKELLHLHMLMFRVREYFAGIPGSGLRTVRYNSLEVSPLHLHKGKKAHTGALLTPGEEIVSHILGQYMQVVRIAPDTVILPVTVTERQRFFRAGIPAARAQTGPEEPQDAGGKGSDAMVP